MPSRGVHFAITAADLATVRARANTPELIEFIEDDLEERGVSLPWACETDKGWLALYCCFNGGRPNPDGGTYPLNHIIVGGDENPYNGDDYFVSLALPQHVRDIAAALKTLTQDDLKRRYTAINRKAYGRHLTDDDFEYTWSCFQDLPTFYANAAADSRAVLFTVAE